MGIDLEVSIQGKLIKERIAIDTGSNGFVSFNNNAVEKYNLNMDSAQKVQTLGRSFRKYRLIADSINAGCGISGKFPVEFLAENISKKYPHSGILGNAFFENFEIIFDFKEYKMYIKWI